MDKISESMLECLSPAIIPLWSVSLYGNCCPKITKPWSVYFSMSSYPVVFRDVSKLSSKYEDETYQY